MVQIMDAITNHTTLPKERKQQTVGELKNQKHYHAPKQIDHGGHTEPHENQRERAVCRRRECPQTT